MKVKLLVIVIVILVLGVVGVMVLASVNTKDLEPVMQEGVISSVGEEGSTNTHLIGKRCNLISDGNSVQDTTCLNYDMGTADFEVEGREFSFAVGVDGNYYRLTDATVRKLERGNYDEFLAEYNTSGVNLIQSVNFSQDIDVPIKIFHSLKNTNPSALTDVTFYYVFDVSNQDSIEINGTLCDWKGSCTAQDYIDRPVVNFNAEYDFRYSDLLENGFELSDIRWAQKKLWVGFSTNGGTINPGETIELDPEFDNTDVEGLDINVLDVNKLVVVWCDETSNNVHAEIYFTNGTQIDSEITVAAVAGCDIDDNTVAVTPLNTSWWTIAYFDEGADDVFFRMYNVSTPITNEYQVDSSVATDGRVDISAINETFIWLAYFDDQDNDIWYAKYAYDGDTTPTEVQAPSTIAGEMNNEGNADNVGIAALNFTHSVITWDDNVGDEISFIVPTIGTKVVVEAIADSAQVSIAAWNSTYFVIGYFQQGSGQDDIVYSTYIYPDTSVSGIVDHDVTAGTGSTTVSEDIAIINATHFVQAWYDDISEHSSFAVSDFNGVAFSGEVDVDAATVVKGTGVASEQFIPGGTVELCEDNIVVAFIKTTTSAHWSAWQPDGTAWDGFCVPPTVLLNTTDEFAYGADTTPTLNFTGFSPEDYDIRYNAQIDTVNTFDSQGGISTEDSHTEDNQDNFYITDTSIYRGQSFLTSVGGDLDNAKFYLQKEGSPTGSVVAELWSIDNEELGFGNLPIALLATSDSLGDVSTIDTSFELIEFTFSGGEQYTLIDGIAYVILLHFDYTSADSSNNINFGGDDTNNVHQGDIYFDTDTLSWSVDSRAVIFYVQTGSTSPLLNKISGTDLAFNNTVSPTDEDPFTTDNMINYTVQAGDALTTDTYFWRVRGQNDDTSGVYGDWSERRNFTVSTAADTCTYTSGTWEVDCADDCVISGEVDLGGDDMSIIGEGTFQTTADIINLGNLIIAGDGPSNQCIVTCDGGCFKS